MVRSFEGADIQRTNFVDLYGAVDFVHKALKIVGVHFYGTVHFYPGAVHLGHNEHL